MVDGYFTDLNQCYAANKIILYTLIQTSSLLFTLHVLCKRSQFNFKGMVNTQHTPKIISKLSTKRPGKFCQQTNLKVLYREPCEKKRGLAHAYRTPGTPKRQKDFMAGRKIILFFLKGQCLEFPASTYYNNILSFLLHHILFHVFFPTFLTIRRFSDV